MGPGNDGVGSLVRSPDGPRSLVLRATPEAQASPEKTTQLTRSPRGAFAVWLQILPDSDQANPGTARTHLLDRCQRSGA